VSTIIWQGTAARPSTAAANVAFTADPATGEIAQASTSGPVTFTPDPGYANLVGSFSSSIDFAPGSQPADPAAAWPAASAHLVILNPGHTYTMVITQD
jgi:hypothetical protein